MSTTATASVTWATIEALIADRWNGQRTIRSGSTRYYRVPAPTGGTFGVEVTLRRRWCSLTVDRWRTTDRDTGKAQPWFKEHIWPYVYRACRARRTGYGILPNGSTIATAYPIDRADLPDALTAWVDQELLWGVPREDATAELHAFTDREPT